MVPQEPPVIRSRSNAFVRRLRELKDRASRELVLLEGSRLVAEALAAGVEILEAAVSPRFRDSRRGRELLRSLEECGATPRTMHEDVLSSLSELTSGEGVLAIGRRPRFAEPQLYEGVPLILVAAGIQNPGNLGGLMRTAEAAGGTGAYLAHGSADPLSWKSLRGSMGSALRLPHLTGGRLPEILEKLKARGVRSVAAVPRAARSYLDVDLRGPVALVVGGEGWGLDEAALAAIDFQVSIPMRGPVESLNVGVAAGILLFEAARQRAK
jgi:TrmH family RNA methyltransferase